MIISEEGKSKSRTFVVSSIIKKLDKLSLNGEHSQQREFSWEKIRQSNLISDILQNNPLPELVFAEQIINNATVIWVIDGKQRCTTLQEFVGNKFAIGANVTRYMIQYSEVIKDEDGCIIRDDEGNVVYQSKEFDIRKKRFKDLPDILKEKLLDYAFNVVYYCNCSDEEIAYHIQRYNSGKPMNAAQKGVTFMGKRNSDAVRNILSMSFFVDGIGAYTPNQFISSAMNRVVAESVMTTRFLDDWCKKFEDSCKFLEKNATADDFEAFKMLVHELEENIECSVGKMFNDTDSFLWFGLYAKFKAMGLNCSDFNVFMKEVDKGIVRNNKGKIDKKMPMSGICVKEIDGVTLDELLRYSSTKDVNIVKTRIDFLAKLACDYFNIEIHEDKESQKEIKNFCSQFDKIGLPHSSHETALKSLIYFTKYPINNYLSENLSKFETWLNESDSIEADCSDCLLWAEVLKEKIDLSAAGDKFSENDIPIMIQMISRIDDEFGDDEIFEWLSELKNESDVEISGESGGIIDKYLYFMSDFKNYINKRKEDVK